MIFRKQQLPEDGKKGRRRRPDGAPKQEGADDEPAPVARMLSEEASTRDGSIFRQETIEEREGEEEEGGASAEAFAEEPVRALLMRALSIRRKKQPNEGMQLGYSLVRLAEWHWNQGEYAFHIRAPSILGRLRY